nr:FkbM family methyltransferase [Gemmatimonadaceae bacterium]
DDHGTCTNENQVFSVLMLKRAARSTLNYLGYELRPSNKSPLTVFLEIVRRYDSSPSFVIDIGANRGRWARIALEHFPTAEYLLIEPQDALRAYSEDLLRKPNVRWLTSGVSDESGDFMLGLSSVDDTTATFNLTDERMANHGSAQVEVPVITLDDLVEKENRVPDMVKIDAEGFDLRVLRGASTLFGVTEIFFVECGIAAPSIENSIEAVCSVMKNNGYRAIDISGINRSTKNGIIWLVDVAFCREASPFWKNFESYG